MTSQKVKNRRNMPKEKITQNMQLYSKLNSETSFVKT